LIRPGEIATAAEQLVQRLSAGLPLDLLHLLTLEQLPSHHRDPFDQLLVAQSVSESLVQVSADAAFYA